LYLWLFAFGLSGLFVFKLGSELYLGSDFSGYVDYTNRKSKYNAFSGAITLCSGVVLLGIFQLFFLWNYSIYTYRDKVVVHWFLSTKARVYPYSQVKSISFNPKPAKGGLEYVVTFKDKTDWNTAYGLADSNTVRNVQFISKQAGIKIDTLYTEKK
jgi:hypothetical protein